MCMVASQGLKGFMRIQGQVAPDERLSIAFSVFRCKPFCQAHHHMASGGIHSPDVNGEKREGIPFILP